ncbi:hypothetical protein ACFPES_30820 [Paenibacillus sp. GCM10023248]|nr:MULTISPECIES: hypothetical protein [Bacillales]MDD9271436.1 hypothetical protein [Paenibacillus sp. MAHUQ-63]MDR6884348.1 hypothetical protein [Bacillus sp. 3255]
MSNLWTFIQHHWISLALILGAILAVWYVYKNKDKYIRGSSGK